ncbi:DUF92 domain-containing protein [Paenibacillus sambharensis]|uniref:DUF92 domain-containing protein n=1 Tax=Paenibacillus sambharensis TaxID=1803190 RepID=A0A2W1L6U8_9BACL|nr:DUF92 domain-containing protein [Paenibacillus sambharensis]PZD95938.1 DUF92 domain-containing protein [Paenibacillus sambharensis]
MRGILDDPIVLAVCALLGSGLIGYAAYRKAALTASGAWAAAVMGTAYVTLGGPVWFGLLIAFFLSSTFWSKWKRKHRRKAKAEAKYAKSGGRDAVQVWANGGLGLLLCAVHALYPHPLLVFGFIGVMAAVNADTWATEIGALSRSKPRMLLGWREVEPGTSGAVTLLGTSAAVAGALFIGIVAFLLMPLGGTAAYNLHPAVIAAAAAAAGTAGAVADSLLGASVQAIYRCSVCRLETESQLHCRTATAKIRGFEWMNNDVVNFASSCLAGLVGAGIGMLAASF